LRPSSGDAADEFWEETLENEGKREKAHLKVSGKDMIVFEKRLGR